MTSGALILWIRIVLVFTSICVTAVPIIYAGAPWRTRLLGRLFMMQAVAFALATDIRVVFIFWKPTSMLINFWVTAITLTLVAIASGALAVLIWTMRHPRR